MNEDLVIAVILLGIFTLISVTFGMAIEKGLQAERNAKKQAAPAAKEQTALEELEAWQNSGGKGRCCRIDHGNGYGAAGWGVELANFQRAVFVHSAEGVDDGLTLEQTIRLALFRANDKGL